MELAGPEPDVQPGEDGREVPVIRSDPYLADFTQLGPQIYIYTPDVDAATTAAPEAPLKSQQQQQQQQQQGEEEQQGQPAPPVPDPDLIIVCSWLGASPRNIVKYTTVYQRAYARSRILLLRQNGGDFFFRTNATQMRNLGPAVSLIRELALTKKKGEGKEELRVLMHIFSNGGSWTACQLADAYYQHQRQRQLQQLPVGSSDEDEANDALLLLPITALVLDSTPSLPNTTAAHTAICESTLPRSSPAPVRALGSALIWTYLRAGNAVEAVTGWENATLSLRRRLNDPRGAFTAHKLPRVYMYSQADAMIPAADVELHAREAAEVLGQEKVRLEDFGTSRHVGHVLADPERYLAVIGGLWKRSVS
ncbi:uncharacterized protein Z520_00668 [Fonsecaea multimorphosa CBS 102226]|uniref:AB hydrolase-1 domain-containing protein n=1 Tax=Fonsecaea multimorphosa CBS 102226 TaxID=1442371 RepID=A0A0D2HQ24_9EURO|nr:uncharacterized protein Z520_00668 [Fonsecaea multimorphosa CBS 102226]KIY03976.1 hypothetical protein Z520_00668 [Fonsecaea multimorphosa CBS 102226]OAL31816.1 hypothetical protein AYO22_00686 [Fonsecaea multimorphosa]